MLCEEQAMSVDNTDSPVKAEIKKECPSTAIIIPKLESSWAEEVHEEENCNVRTYIFILIKD